MKASLLRAFGGGRAPVVVAVVDPAIAVVVSPVAACGPPGRIRFAAGPSPRATRIFGEVDMSVAVVVQTIAAVARRRRIGLVVASGERTPRVLGKVDSPVPIVVDAIVAGQQILFARFIGVNRAIAPGISGVCASVSVVVHLVVARGRAR